MCRPRCLLAIPLLSIAVVFGGCATPQSVQNIEDKVSDLERQNFELRKQLAEAKVRLEIRNEALGRSPGAGVSRQSAPVADTEVLDSRTADTPQTAQVMYSEPMTPYDTAQSSPAFPAGAKTGAADLMATAARLLDEKNPEGALGLFRQILTKYPGDPLADDAQFGAAECFFQMGKYDEAIVEYRKVVNDFPFGDQVPFAFLKIGFSHLALDQRDLALDNFRNVSEAYPGTEAATVARQQIAHLTRQSREATQDKQPAQPNR